MRSWEKSMIAEDAIDHEVERHEAAQEPTATKRFVTTVITGNGASEFDQRDDLEDAIQEILDTTGDLEGTPSTIFTFQTRDTWDARALVFEVSRREPQKMLAPGVIWPIQYSQIVIRLKSLPNFTVTGTFRARVASVDNCGFDHQGSAIWVTGILEHFIPIDDIAEIVVID